MMQKLAAQTSIFLALIVLTVFPASAWTQTFSLATVSGKYLGNIPCADCEKIVFTLHLKSDSTYSSSMIYVGKSVQPFTEQGLFRVTETGLIELDTARGGMKLFKKQQQGLLMLDTAGNQITGALAEKYMLYAQSIKDEQVERQPSMSFMKNKWQQGIDFYAVGNLPSWSLDLDFEKVFHFKIMDGPEINTPSVEGDKAQDALVTRYRTVTESGEMIITIYGEQVCRDQLSDQSYDRKVKVEFKHHPADDFTAYTGCGNYVPDIRIHDIWAVSALGTTKLAAADFRKGIPAVEIDINQNRVSGHDGCNNFMGSAVVKGRHITFGNLAGTRMVCPNMQESTRISKTLSGKAYTFTIKDNQLLLQAGDQVVMTLQHRD